MTTPTPPYDLKWSYSMLSTFSNCPKRFWHQYIAKDVERTTSLAAEAGVKVHSVLETAVCAPAAPDLPETLAHVTPIVEDMRRFNAQVELSLGVREDWSPCGFFDSDVWGRVRIDVAVIHPLNTACALVDWKNGNPKNAKYMDNFELRVQAAILAAHYPTLRVIKGRYYWTKAKPLGWPEWSETYDLSDIGGHRFAIQNLYDRINERRPEHFTTKKSPLCAYCPVKRCQYWKPLPIGA